MSCTRCKQSTAARRRLQRVAEELPEQQGRKNEKRLMRLAQDGHNVRGTREDDGRKHQVTLPGTDGKQSSEAAADEEDGGVAEHAQHIELDGRTKPVVCDCGKRSDHQA